MKGNVLTQWKSDLRSGLFGDKTIYRHVWFDKGPVVMNMNVLVVKNASFFEKISQNKVENRRVASYTQIRTCVLEVTRKF